MNQREPIIIEVGVFKPKQLLRIRNIESVYPINKVTDKAVLIECDNGRWVDNGKFVPLWIPISQMTFIGVNSSTDNSQYGIHVIELPEWLIRANSKKW